MRILIINSEYPPVGGGAGNASAHIARELATMDQEVTVLTSRFANFPHDELQQGIRLVRVPSLRRSESSSGPLEQLSFMVGAILGSFQLARHWKPDGVITFFGVPSGPAGWALRKTFGVPYIVSLRGGDVPGFRPYDFSLYHRLIAPLIRLVWRGAETVVANSAGLRELAKKFIPAMEIEIIPNGIDLDVFSPAPRSWTPPHLLFVGRLVYQKGLDLLLVALAKLINLKWEMTFVGDGSQLEELKQMAFSLGIQDRICFAGWRSRDELIHYYQEANLFVFPSRHEGMPNALLEAMSSGLPAIATRIAGNEELVLDRHSGLLIPPNDIEALKDALHELLTKEDLCREMGTAAREYIASSYSWKVTAQTYLDLLKVS